MEENILADQDPTLAEFVDELEPANKPMAPALGNVSVRGAFWTVTATILIKIFSLVSQIALAWFLVPSDIGLLAFAFSITSVAQIVTCGGLIQVMVQSRTPIEQESTQVFWLSLTMHLVAVGICIVTAPIAGILFADRRVVPLIIVTSLSWPIGSLSAIYIIKLMRDLRFKTLAAIQLANGLITAVSSVAFAAMGWGAYSLIFPVYLCYIASLWLNRRASGPLPIGRPHPHVWFAMLVPTLWLTVQSMSIAVQDYGTSFVIGTVLKDPVITGLYFWGFTLSGQAVFLVVNSLRGVIFPSLARLNDEPERQYAGFQRALRLLILAAVPLSLLQAIAAEPIVHLCFHSRWFAAVGVVQYLSIGLLTQPLQLMTLSLFLARGKFRWLTALSGFQAVIILVASLLGALAGTPTSIAICVGCALFFNGLLSGWCAERLFGRGWHAVFESCRQVLFPAIASAIIAYLGLLASRPAGAFVALLASSTLFIVAFVLLIIRFARRDVIDLLERIRLRRIAVWLQPNVG